MQSARRRDFRTQSTLKMRCTSTHPDMFKRNRENLAREIKQDIVELREVVQMKEKEERETQALLDQPPTEEQIRATTSWLP